MCTVSPSASLLIRTTLAPKLGVVSQPCEAGRLWGKTAGKTHQEIHVLVEHGKDAWLRIPVIPATQSGAKLPPNPKEACHLIRPKAAPQRSPIGAQRRLD